MWPSPFKRREPPPPPPDIDDVLGQLAAIRVMTPVEEQMRALDRLAEQASACEYLSGKEKLSIIQRIAAIKKAITPKPVKEPKEKKGEKEKSAVRNDAKLLKEFEKKSAGGA